VLYQGAKKKFDEDSAFADRARKRVVALQAGDPPTLALWRYLIEESNRHFNAAYARLNVGLTDADVRAESFYNASLAQTVDDLLKKRVAVVSDGAVCVFAPGFVGPDGNPAPLIIRKSDGGYGYGTTDLAAIRFRSSQLHAQRIVYVTDARQKDHFAKVYWAAKQAGWLTDTVHAEHVPFGTVLGQDGKPFKTRSGETVKLVDLLDEAEQRAKAIISQKNPDLPGEQRDAVARAIGIGAIKYADLVNDRIKDYVFDWDRMLSFDGNTAPYLQNAYVRIRSIFRKAESQGIAAPGDAAIALRESAERALAVKLLQFAASVESVATSLEPHRLCTYLYELAALYHQFYEKCPVVSAPDEATRSSRLALSKLTASVLKQGLDLLGIAVVEQM
jgi:arginyl-tRNA synthetase